MIPDRDTIFALSSGPGPAAIAVIRVTGPHAQFALQQLAGRLPRARQASLAALRDPATDEPLDQALVLWLPGPHSHTGEDVAELHVHGGRAVVTAVLSTLGRLPGLRPAQAGEFTRRAFENGRLDLTEVEGLADLILADTEEQRRQAYRQAAGALGERVEDWRSQLIDALALIEAGIDFADEGDVPKDLMTQAMRCVSDLRADIGAALAASGRGERLREGLTVAIVGPPNSGKSSLLNRIARREVAIVTPFAGTTRDVIEVRLDLDGFPVTVLDTAGLRDTDDPAEQEGVRRARARAKAADLVLWVFDASGAVVERGPGEEPAESAPGEKWLVANKIDLIDSDSEQFKGQRFGSERILRTSAQTGEGMDELVAALGRFASEFFAGAERGLMSRERHRTALRRCSDALARAVSLGDGPVELVAEELRLAGRELGRLSGRVDAEEILDRVFRDFCIGK